ncbi:MAG: hypothetical protein KKB37_13785 [Alphaproteobacteria bacterium]|nr:hypothetical protein [Alphaproteobacteria bacterium]
MADFAYQLVIWFLVLVLAIPYVGWARHPDSKPLAGYLIFIAIFSALSWISFSLLSILIDPFIDRQAANLDAIRIIIFVLSILIGVAVAHWQISKPPRVGPPI